MLSNLTIFSFERFKVIFKYFKRFQGISNMDVTDFQNNLPDFVELQIFQVIKNKANN